MGKTVRDGLWIWGHPENSCKDYTGGTRDRDYSVAEGTRYLGARNVFYVAFGHKMDLAACAKDMDGIVKTGLAVEKWGDPAAEHLAKTFSYAPLFPNLDRMVYDDFFGMGEPEHIRVWHQFTIPELMEVRDKVHAAGLSLWVVLYQHQLDMPIREYLDVFDGISFWFWNEPSVESYHEYSKKFLDLTKGKRRLIGCYLFNFGLRLPAHAELVRYQLDRNLELMRAGEIEGVVLHNNDLQGLGFDAYEEAKKWVDEHGDEILP